MIGLLAWMAKCEEEPLGVAASVGSSSYSLKLKGRGLPGAVGDWLTALTSPAIQVQGQFSSGGGVCLLLLGWASWTCTQKVC